LAQSVESNVLQTLRMEPRLGPHFHLDRISLETDGALALKGNVASLAEKKLALLHAARTPGVSRIADQIRVIPAMPMGDKEMRDRLANTLAMDADFADLDFRKDVAVGVLATEYKPVAGAAAGPRGRIDVEVEDGVIILNGSVPTLVRKRLAGALAWRIPGVRDVINGLAVEPPEDDGPDQLEEAVRVVLERNRLFDAAQVKAGVRNRVVRLTGVVRSGEARAAAANDAWSVFGVDDVLNEIEVRA
jgi:osmotically-inducible protein OsmY